MLVVSFAAAIALGFFRTFLLVNYIEPETGFYVPGTNIGDVFSLLLLLFVGVILLLGFFTRKKQPPEHLDSKSTIVVFTSALCAFVYVSLFLFGIYSIVTSTAKTNYFLVAELALCIPCCFNHISVCSKEIREKNTPHALLAMSEAVFFAVRLIEVFMDTKSQINVSQRSLEVVMLCCVMLFFLLEAQFLVSREEENMKSLSKYFMAGVAAASFPVIAVLPYLAVSLFWCFDSKFVVMEVLDCCVMLFAASRMLTLKFEK